MGIIRKTKMVNAVVQLFEQQDNALSVVDLVARFKGKANKSTIYRILERLENEGLIHSFTGPESLIWYAKCSDGCSADAHQDVHPHFQCQACGKVECLPVNIVIPKLKKHKIESAEILLKGHCEACTA